MFKKLWTTILVVCFNLLIIFILLPQYMNNCMTDVSMEGFTCVFITLFFLFMLVLIQVILLFILTLIKIFTPDKSYEILMGIIIGISISLLIIVITFLLLQYL